MKQVAISAQGGSIRIAFMENGKLQEWRTQDVGTHASVGDIYQGRIADVKPGIQSAFVDIGTGQNAYLYVDDTVGVEPGGTAKPSIAERVHVGQKVLVQVSKEAMEMKAPKITMRISLQGRYLVYLPTEESISLSRKISDDTKRKRLQQVISSTVEQGEGCILRTEAAEAEEQTLISELTYLRKRWKDMLRTAEGLRSTGRIFQDAELIEVALRDGLANGMDEVLVEGAATHQEVKAALAAFAPEVQEKLRWYQGKQPLFDFLGVEAELIRARDRQVPLNSGGSLVIDRTEAMTVIDVNTGSFTGGGGQQREQAVTATNLEAVAEIARQLRLRDIGGIVIIDFIDMKEQGNKERVISRLKQELAKDPVPSTVLGMTSLGLVEMTRKRVRASLMERLTEPCEACKGRGRVWRVDELFRRLYAEVTALAKSQDAEAVLVDMPPRVLDMIDEWEKAEAITWPVQIYKRLVPSMSPDNFQIGYVGNRAEAQRLQSK
ncbi:Rne/Rng family ribonuclease [Brevibacillus sp. MER 51]|uniref:Rne/Rng family ribonuclease n=1 Tax=Brevibacillus sp. MER 51 TaxID=2939560 RepID=UPI00203B5354|nr:Rne/Rng family ribonuclease [Brevibacillus sp. MER 51]